MSVVGQGWPYGGMQIRCPGDRRSASVRQNAGPGKDRAGCMPTTAGPRKRRGRVIHQLSGERSVSHVTLDSVHRFAVQCSSVHHSDAVLGRI